MRRGSWAVLLSIAVLVLAVWVTSADPVHLLPDSPTAATHRSSTTHNQTPPGILQKPTLQPPVRQVKEFTFGLVGYLILGAVAAALLAYLFSAVILRERRREGGPGTWSPPRRLPRSDALDVPESLRRAAERQLVVIREGSPRNAIVACWMELERACRESGFPRRPAETSSEFTERMLARYVVDLTQAGTTVDTLAALYREARFSTHPMVELDRERAVATLEAILASLHAHQDRDDRDPATAAPQ